MSYYCNIIVDYHNRSCKEKITREAIEICLVYDHLPNIRCWYLSLLPLPSFFHLTNSTHLSRHVVETMCSPNPLPFLLAIELVLIFQHPLQLGRALKQGQWNLVEVIRPLLGLLALFPHPPAELKAL